MAARMPRWGTLSMRPRALPSVQTSVTRMTMPTIVPRTGRMLLVVVRKASA